MIDFVIRHTVGPLDLTGNCEAQREILDSEAAAARQQRSAARRLSFVATVAADN